MTAPIVSFLLVLCAFNGLMIAARNAAWEAEVTPEEAIRLISRYHPCPHENWEALGYGTVWGKCEDCGETFDQSRLEKLAESSMRFDEAVGILRTLIRSQEG